MKNPTQFVTLIRIAFPGVRLLSSPFISNISNPSPFLSRKWQTYRMEVLELK